MDGDEKEVRRKRIPKASNIKIIDKPKDEILHDSITESI